MGTVATGITVGVVADVDAATQIVGPFANTLNEHPVVSTIAHVVLIAVVMAVCTTIVAALFKSPFER